VGVTILFIPIGSDDPANVGAIIPLLCQGAVNPANAGIDASIYPILDLELISPTDTLITTLGIQLLPLDVPSFLYQKSTLILSFLFFLILIYFMRPLHGLKRGCVRSGFHTLQYRGTCSCLASPLGDASRYTYVLVYF